mmetsp:Transcript_44059/g.44717  ORF Transcript_44059/g.44717 Transcript_44059/m.44717 type:complete len:150 (-) Transcript_44059:337-786(-)
MLRNRRNTLFKGTGEYALQGTHGHVWYEPTGTWEPRNTHAPTDHKPSATRHPREPMHRTHPRTHTGTNSRCHTVLRGTVRELFMLRTLPSLGWGTHGRRRSTTRRSSSSEGTAAKKKIVARQEVGVMKNQAPCAYKQARHHICQEVDAK